MAKVLFITPISGLVNPYNGGQIRSRQILNELSHKFEIDILTPSKIEGIINENIFFINSRIIHLIFRLRHKRGLSRVISWFDFLLCFIQKKKYSVNSIESYIAHNIIKRNGYSMVILDTLTWVQPN